MEEKKLTNSYVPENTDTEIETHSNEDIFEPVLGELVADDSFAFTLLSCHC